MEATLNALSSDGETVYPVNFTYVDGVLRAKCGCKAGQFARFCKHVASFLAGDPKLLADASEGATLATVTQWADTAGFAERSREVVALEKQVEEAKAKLKRAKAQLWRELYEGFKA